MPNQSPLKRVDSIYDEDALTMPTHFTLRSGELL